MPAIVRQATQTCQISKGDPWQVLMVSAQNGDAAEYRVLLKEIEIWLKRFFRRRLPPDQVEDAVQDTLIAVHTKRHTYDPKRPFLPWLAAIARYKWIDRLRSRTREPMAELLDEHAVDGHEAAVTSAIVLERLLTKLKPAQSTVIRLVKLQGLSIEEAAVATGQSKALVKVNIHRGLAKLHLQVEDDPDAY